MIRIHKIKTTHTHTSKATCYFAFKSGGKGGEIPANTRTVAKSLLLSPPVQGELVPSLIIENIS